MDETAERTETIAETTVVSQVVDLASSNGETPPKTKKAVSIALCAHSQRTRDLAPVTDDDWIIFGLNNLQRFIGRGHMWIQIHSPQYLANHPAYSKEDLAFYETMQIPLFTREKYPQWPTSVPLPLDRLRKRFPRITWDSTMCFMVGLAILMIEEQWLPSLPGAEGTTRDLNTDCVPARRFGMWGLDMLDNYAKQGPNVGYLIGQADAAGIEVVVPRQAGFFRRAWLYGYDEKENGKRRSQIETRKAELEGGLKQIVDKRGKMAAEMGAIDQRIISMQAALQENDYQFKNWTLEDDEAAPAETLAEAKKVVLALGGNAKE